MAKVLREDSSAAFEVEKAVKLVREGEHKPPQSALDVFMSLPDISGPEFDEVFDQPRADKWRKIEL